MRSRAFALGSMLLALVLAGLAAWALADNQANQRRDLRNRFVDRTQVASSLVDSLFRVAFNSQARDLSERFARSVDDRRTDALAKRSQLAYAVIADSSGRVLAASRAAPADVGARLAKRPFALRSALHRGFGIGDAHGGVVEAVIAFGTKAGPRLLVSGTAIRSYAGFLGGTLRPLATLKGSESLVLDDHGVSLGGVAYGGARAAVTRGLVEAAMPGAATHRTFSENGQKSFVGSAPLPSTRWRIVVSAPEKELYASASGAGRWVPWGILLLGTVALLGVSFLLWRLAKTAFMLRESNSELGASRRRLEDRARELERSNADLEQFAYAASHDLSEPLRTVAGFSQLLRSRYAGRLDPDADEYIGHMVAGVERMQQLIDDLLLYSRVGRAPLREADVDLEATLADVLDWLAPAIEARGGRVTHDPLPRVRGERGQLAQVLQNVIANAVKFTAAQTTPAVHVSAAREGATAWRISVRDNGIGVDGSAPQDIFKMFGRLHASDEYPGTGIGLALAKRIVEGHGGRIWVEPAPGGGSVFFFTVPAASRVREEAMA